MFNDAKKKLLHLKKLINPTTHQMLQRDTVRDHKGIVFTELEKNNLRSLVNKAL